MKVSILIESVFIFLNFLQNESTGNSGYEYGIREVGLAGITSRNIRFIYVDKLTSNISCA